MQSSIKTLINTKDYQGLREALSTHPELANEGIPCDEVIKTLAHPLHRICDGVFTGKYTDNEAVEFEQSLIIPMMINTTYSNCWEIWLDAILFGFLS